MFYAIWEGAQRDPGAKALLDALAEGRALAADVDAGFERRPFWEVWRSGEDPRLHYALLVVRVTARRLRLSDYARRFARSSLADYRAGRREAIADALEELRELYPATAPNAAGARLTTKTTIDDRGKELLEAVDSVRGDSTDGVLDALGGELDSLAAGSADSTARERADFGSALAAKLRAQNRRGEDETSSWVQDLIEAHRRAEMRFFERVEADNLGALSRVYARLPEHGAD